MVSIGRLGFPYNAVLFGVSSLIECSLGIGSEPFKKMFKDAGERNGVKKKANHDSSLDPWQNLNPSALEKAKPPTNYFSSIWQFIMKGIPKLFVLVMAWIFIKQFYLKVVPKRRKKQSTNNTMVSSHNGMIQHVTANPYQTNPFANQDELAYQQKVEYYGRYINPITGLPSFPDYMTQDERQLEEIRRMDGTNRWMTNN